MSLQLTSNIFCIDFVTDLFEIRVSGADDGSRLSSFENLLDNVCAEIRQNIL